MMNAIFLAVHRGRDDQIALARGLVIAHRDDDESPLAKASQNPTGSAIASSLDAGQH
jgi:hypothetical protein